MLLIYTTQQNVLDGFPLLTAFCSIYLFYTFWRDFVLISVLSFASDTLKYALQYRLGSCIVDFACVFVVACSCINQMMSEEGAESSQNHAAPTQSVVTSERLQKLINDSDFGACFLLLLTNVVSQFIFYLFFRFAERVCYHLPFDEIARLSRSQQAINAIKELRTDIYANFSKKESPSSGVQCTEIETCCICLLELKSEDKVRILLSLQL